MAAGLPVTVADLNYAVGKMSLDIHHGYENAVSLKAWLDTNYPTANPDPLIAAFGYSAGDAATVRTAIDDAAYQATQAYGSSTALKKVRGLGI